MCDKIYKINGFHGEHVALFIAEYVQHVDVHLNPAKGRLD